MTERDERLERIETKLDLGSKLFQDLYGHIDSLGERIERLEATQQGTNERLDVTNERLDATNERLETLAQSTREGFAVLGAAQQRTNERLDRLIDLHTRSFTDWVERYQNHEQRLAKLEARVDRLEE